MNGTPTKIYELGNTHQIIYSNNIPSREHFWLLSGDILVLTTELTVKGQLTLEDELTVN